MTHHPTYLIIGGTTKAGTTSLFNYLADHPAVCASNVKETRFFLEPAYALESKYRLEDGLDKYATFFNHCAERSLYLEATPDYLYSRQAPQRIDGALPGARLLFLLREPVDRLISWYRFAKQLGSLATDVSFDAFVAMQNQDPEVMSADQHLDALVQGRYSLYLERYYAQFAAGQICVVNQGTMAQQTQAVLTALCSYLGLDPSPYQDYKFQAFNRTQKMRNTALHKVYVESIRRLRRHIHDKPVVRAALRRMRRAVEPLYLRMNAQAEEGVQLSQATRRFLEEYYREEPARLARLLGSPRFDWQTTDPLIFTRV